MPFHTILYKSHMKIIPIHSMDCFECNQILSCHLVPRDMASHGEQADKVKERCSLGLTKYQRMLYPPLLGIKVSPATYPQDSNIF